jgi:ubiquitin-conjugating enzyme E2 C
MDMDYNMEMEDSQNSAPDAPSMAETKLAPPTRRPDTQSVTKRYLFPSSPPQNLTLMNIICSLQNELLTLMLNPTPGISAFPDSPESSLLAWTATISGPPDTPYNNLSFKLSFVFPTNYPYSPPVVLFKTPIYHPNVDFSGRICLDIRKEKWSAVLNVGAVLVSLQSLLGEPNNASPLNGQAAELWDSDPVEYKRQVLARHQDVDED